MWERFHRDCPSRQKSRWNRSHSLNRTLVCLDLLVVARGPKLNCPTSALLECATSSKRSASRTNWLGVALLSAGNCPSAANVRCNIASSSATSRRETSISSPKKANTLLTRGGIGSIDVLALDLTASERLNWSTQIDKTAVAVSLFLPAPIHRLSEDLPRVRLDLVWRY